MKLYFWLKELSLSEERGFGLDPSNVSVENSRSLFPLSRILTCAGLEKADHKPGTELPG